MGNSFFNEYPYTDFHELNLSWVIKELRTFATTLEQFVSINALKYADPIQWNITTQYEKNTIVIDPQTGVAYISVAAVPAGVALTNADYWTEVFDLGRFVVRAAQNFTTRYEEETTTTATFNIPAGYWVVWGDTLYRANVNITAGDSYVEGGNITHITVEEITGHLAELTTSDKSNLVAAINEVLTTLTTTTGDLDDLTTTDKSNLVAAINEVLTTLTTTLNNATGDLNDLTTTDKSNLVAAINEVNSTGGGAIGMIGDLNDLGTTDKSNVVNAINELLGDIGAIDDKYGVVCVSDFNPALGGADDSVAVQSAVDFAASHNITLVSFKNIDTISFKNVSVSSSMILMLGDTVVQGLQKSGEGIFKLFDITGSDIDVAIVGGTIRGLLDTGAYPGTPLDPVVFVHDVHSFTVSQCNIEYINNDIFTPPSTMVECVGGTFTIHDCRYTYILNCNFDHCRAEELMYIIDDALDRTEVNMEMRDCVFGSNIDTTVFDFVGNNCILEGNRYYFDYAGSVVNAFALNLKAENESFYGNIVNMYDNSEGMFQGLTASFKNIRTVTVQTGFIIAAQFIDLDNISIFTQHASDSYMRVLALSTGYGASTTFHKDNATSLCWIRNVSVRNVDLRLLSFTSNSDIMLVHAMATQSIAWNVTPLILLENCLMPGGNTGTNIKAPNCDITLLNCNFKPHIISAISGTSRVALDFRSAVNAQPAKIKAIGCVLENYDSTAIEYLLYDDAVPYVVNGCIATGASDKINITTYSGAVGVGGNVNLT